MHYATIDNTIGSASELPDGAVEISREQYKELMADKASGDRVTIVDGDIVTYAPPVYSPDGTKRTERAPDEPLITAAPPEELRVPQWDGAQWVEGETDAQREAREEAEAIAERERLDAMTATRFQAKAAMDDAGLLDQVEAYMAGEDVPRRVKLAWQEASFRRGSNMVNQIGTELGLSESEIDNLFLAAQQIDA